VKGGRLKIVNESRYADGEVEALVRFGLQDIDLKGEKLLAVVSNTRTREYRGWAGTRVMFWRSDSTAGRVAALVRRHKPGFIIHMMVGPPTKFPIRPYRRNGFVHDYRTWQEALVGITAHEGMHVQHFYDSAYGHNGRRRTGSRRIEPKCEAFEQFMLRRYRESLLTPPEFATVSCQGLRLETVG
jgi:hypothetical protein